MFLTVWPSFQWPNSWPRTARTSSFLHPCFLFWGNKEVELNTTESISYLLICLPTSGSFPRAGSSLLLADTHIQLLTEISSRRYLQKVNLQVQQSSTKRWWSLISMHTDIPIQTWTILENLPPNSPVPSLDLIVYLLRKRHYNESWHSEPQPLKAESKAEWSPPSTSFNTQNVAFLPRYYWMTTLPSSATNAMICFKNIIRKDGKVSSESPPLKNQYIDLHLGWVRQFILLRITLSGSLEISCQFYPSPKLSWNHKSCTEDVQLHNNTKDNERLSSCSWPGWGRVHM